jgi:hypothetical protein
MRAVALSLAKDSMPTCPARDRRRRWDRASPANSGACSARNRPRTGAIGRELLVEAREHRRDCRVGIERQHERTDFGAQEMIGAGRAERREIAERVRIDEFQHFGRVAEKCPILRSCEEILPRIAGSSRAAISRARLARKRRSDAPPNAGSFSCAASQVGRLLDDRAASSRSSSSTSAPGEQAVAAEHDADIFGMSLAIAPSFRPRSKPGRCHGRKPISPP